MKNLRLIFFLSAGLIFLLLSFTSNQDLSSEDLTIVDAQEAMEGDGARVKRLFPTRKMKHLDPFVLIDEFFVTPPAGFPEHPHRGFEAVTYMLDGAFIHKDNMGFIDTVTSGGSQRFTAGKGMRHSEMPANKTGTSHGLQLWINLPKSMKQIDPEYQKVIAKNLPKTITSDYELIQVIGENSPLTLKTKVNYIDLKLYNGKDYALSTAIGEQGFLYLLEGTLSTSTNQSLHAGQAIVIRKPTSFEIKATTLARLVFIKGTALQEPIKQRGPFVD